MKNINDLEFFKEDLSGTDFSEFTARNAKFIDCNLSDTNFYRADLSGAEFDGSALSGANFERADLYGAFMRRTDLSRANFSRAYMCGLDCSSSDFTDAILDEAYLFGTNLSKCKLINTKMNKTHIIEVDFTGAEIKALWNGVPLSRVPIVITGLGYPIKITDSWMEIGCQGNTVEWFQDSPLSDREIAALEGTKSARFWKKHKNWILDLIKASGINKS